MRNAATQTQSAPSPAVTARHVGHRRSLIDEHQFQWIEIELTVEPCPTPLTDVGPVLFVRVRGLFLNVMSWRSKKRQIIDGDTLSPRVRSSRSQIFVKRQVRLAPVKAQQVIRMRLHALRTGVAAHRKRPVAAALAQRRHPTDRAGEAYSEPPRRRPAAHTFLANRRNHPFAQIHRQRTHPAPPPIRRTQESHFLCLGNPGP
jgi:hypothetical protein